jgi:hypothetical protein
MKFAIIASFVVVSQAFAGALVCAPSTADTLTLASGTYYSPGEAIPAWSVIDSGSVTLLDDSVVLIDGQEPGWLRGSQSVAVMNGSPGQMVASCICQCGTEPDGSGHWVCMGNSQNCSYWVGKGPCIYGGTKYNGFSNCMQGFCAP